MPIDFSEYEGVTDVAGGAIDPDSNAYRILAFLASNPDLGFTPKEIHRETGIPRGSVGTTLSRLEERGLVRHKEPYWAADPRGIEAYEAVLSGLRVVEASTTYEWGDADPASYRVGLESVSSGARDDGA